MRVQVPWVGAVTGWALTGMMDRPYGSWESPITSQAITAGSVGMSSLKVLVNSGDDDSNDDDDTKKDLVYWIEMRPQEGGRHVLCHYDNGDDNGRVDVTPPNANVRTRVHEYGGGAVTMTTTRGSIFYSEFTTQQLHHYMYNKTTTSSSESSSSSVPLTPPGNLYRFADGVHDNKRDVIFCVREDHTNPQPKHVVNEIVAVKTTPTPTHEDSESTMTVVATGNDFFAAPRLSPDNTHLAYITWNHPNMPWDATYLKIVTLSSSSSSSSWEEQVAKNQDTSFHTLVAGSNGDTSVLQPLWHPLTGDLYYISDESGFYNIYKVAVDTVLSSNNISGTTTTTIISEPINVLPMEYDFGGAAPGWSLGQQGFTFLNDGRLVATYTKNGTSVLIVANVTSTTTTTKEDGPVANDIQEYTMEHGLPQQFGGVVAGSNDTLYFMGGSPSTPMTIYKWNLNTQQSAQPLVCSSTVTFSKNVISSPQAIQFPTTTGLAYGYYYPPTNAAFLCTTEAAPPLLVKAHGGPTACTSTLWNAGIQFWTSRGFAVLDVDYGGSTGYGREYRRRLRKSWGIVDIDDVCAGARYLVAQGLADVKRLCIDGGSAGGYTTLGALAFQNVFSAGCSLYGVGDLTALASDTHKFESRYLDGLVGPFPQDEQIYRDRSPIHSVDTLACPILLLQGDQDKVVPPNQAEMMHQALLQKGIPTCLKMYQGEQHGFRKAENIRDALDSELAFYGRVFGFDVPGGIDLQIDNM
jgi:dienelactone hydrolase